MILDDEMVEGGCYTCGVRHPHTMTCGAAQNRLDGVDYYHPEGRGAGWAPAKVNLSTAADLLARRGDEWAW